MNIFTKILLVTFLSTTAVNAYGFDLKAARKSGAVKELPTGYLKAVDPKTKKKVKEINAKRFAHYDKISDKTGIKVEDVAKRAAKKIKSKK